VEQIHKSPCKSRIGLLAYHWTLWKRHFKNSLCFGVVLEGNPSNDTDLSSTTTPSEMVAFGSLVTDHATFAYLSDVCVKPVHRGCGVGKYMIRSIMSCQDVHGFRRIMLATKDAHGLYEPFGFSKLEDPSLFMEIYRPNEIDHHLQSEDDQVSGR
jgi:GNAT superfamily N-acetyltransferase